MYKELIDEMKTAAKQRMQELYKIEKGTYPEFNQFEPLTKATKIQAKKRELLQESDFRFSEKVARFKGTYKVKSENQDLESLRIKSGIDAIKVISKKLDVPVDVALQLTRNMAMTSNETALLKSNNDMDRLLLKLKFGSGYRSKDDTINIEALKIINPENDFPEERQWIDRKLDAFTKNIVHKGTMIDSPFSEF